MCVCECACDFSRAVRICLRLPLLLRCVHHGWHCMYTSICSSIKSHLSSAWNSEAAHGVIIVQEVPCPCS